MLTINADNLPRFMQCRGSRLMPPSFPQSEGDQTARNEGIAAHEMAKLVFNNDFALDELIDRKAPNGVYFTSEMADHVGEYISALDCGEVEADTSFGGDTWRIGARCDHRVYTASTDTLTIDDFKYGHSPVDPEMNWTLIAHAIGTCVMMQIAPATIVLRIHQPRPFHPDGKLREWRITYARLMELYTELAEALTNPGDMLQTGPRCKRCWADATCPAYRVANMNGIDALERAVPDQMTGAQLAYELTTSTIAFEAMKNRKSALEEMALHRVKLGEVIEDYASEPQYAHSRWITGLDAATLGVMAGADLTKPGLVTPAEAKRRGIPEHVVKSLTERPLTGTKLVRVSATKRAQRLLGKED